MSEQERILNLNVGILGHIDSGKTSLAKAISTQRSTASFDKSPQSQERGITLDLGFSALLLDLPQRFAGLPYDKLQFTFVDCPGHASLIKTIIGGAQIIDMMILVIDIQKGFQTQTAEGLVIGEIATDKLIVVINKIDLIEEANRQKEIEKMKVRIAKTLSTTKFSGSQILAVSANPNLNPNENSLVPSDELSKRKQGIGIGIEEFIRALVDTVEIPKRDASGPFLFEFDHCFQIKGQGTVLTGTVLSGSVSINQTFEIPALKLQKKVKSIQMFRRPVTTAKQGDRIGICVTQLDPSLLERGLAADVGKVITLSSAIVTVNKIKYYKFPLKNKSKLHITVGHETVMSKVHYFSSQNPDQRTFDMSSQYLHVEEVPANHPKEDQDKIPGTIFAVLELEKPITCPRDSLIIASRLETDIHLNTCRIAFSGKIVQPFDFSDPMTRKKLQIFKTKTREALIDRVQDERTLIGKNLFKKECDLSIVVGLKVTRSTDGSVGTIESAFGKTGKFKVYFQNGTTKNTDGTLTLNYKYFVFDKATVGRRLIQ